MDIIDPTMTPWQLLRGMLHLSHVLIIIHSDNSEKFMSQKHNFLMCTKGPFTNDVTQKQKQKKGGGGAIKNCWINLLMAFNFSYFYIFDLFWNYYILHVHIQGEGEVLKVDKRWQQVRGKLCPIFSVKPFVNGPRVLSWLIFYIHIFQIKLLW